MVLKRARRVMGQIYLYNIYKKKKKKKKKRDRDRIEAKPRKKNGSRGEEEAAAEQKKGKKKSTRRWSRRVTPQGLEPWFQDSESCVLTKLLLLS
jgi:hypothetical protein